MLDAIPYPGHCFGTYEKTSKECRKCKLKKNCILHKRKDTKNPNRTSMEFLFDTAQEKGILISLLPQEGIRLSFDTELAEVKLYGDGKLSIIYKNGDSKDFNYLVSEEQAKEILSSIGL